MTDNNNYVTLETFIDNNIKYQLCLYAYNNME